MTLNEILFMSFCSKRVQKSIRQRFKLESNEGFRIACDMNGPRSYKMEPCQDVDEKRLELIVDHGENDKKVIKWKYVDSLENLDILKEFRLVEGLRDATLFDIKFKSGLFFEINGLRWKCSISFDPKSGIPTLYFEKHLMKKWPMEIQKYCVELFRTTADVEMILNLNDLSDVPEPLTIKDLYVQTCQDDVAPTIAEELFEKADIERLSVRIQYFTGYLSDDSTLEHPKFIDFV
ncbi:unnamed protein product [Caenorhabditis nigoni]